MQLARCEQVGRAPGRSTGVCDGQDTGQLPRPSPAQAGSLTSVPQPAPPHSSDPSMRFPLLQQREPFKKRWFALDPQERRLLYYKNPLVRATAGPCPVHPQTGGVCASWGLQGNQQYWNNLVREMPPSLLTLVCSVLGAYQHCPSEMGW